MQDHDDVDWAEIVGHDAYDEAMKEDLESRKHDEFVREFKAWERKAPVLDRFGTADSFKEQEEPDKLLHELLG